MASRASFPAPPLAAVALLLNKHSPHEIAEAVEIMIDVLDMIGGDHDADAEDDDPAEPTGDEADASWTEFHTRGRHKLAGGMSEPFHAQEDAEEDDPAGQCDEDGVNTQAAMARGTGPGCPIADPDGEHDGREEEYGPGDFSDPVARREQRDRIRRTRCTSYVDRRWRGMPPETRWYLRPEGPP